MTHSEFVAAYTSGRLQVQIPPKEAARFISGRMLLPLFLLPVFGGAVALALIHAWVWAVLVFVAGLALRALVRATAHGYVLQRALANAAFYEQARAAGLLQMSAA